MKARNPILPTQYYFPDGELEVIIESDRDIEIDYFEID